MYVHTYVHMNIHVPFFSSLLPLRHSVIPLYIHHNNTDIPHVYIPSTKIETLVIL